MENSRLGSVENKDCPKKPRAESLRNEFIFNLAVASSEVYVPMSQPESDILPWDLLWFYVETQKNKLEHRGECECVHVSQ